MYNTVNFNAAAAESRSPGLTRTQRSLQTQWGHRGCTSLHKTRVTALLLMQKRVDPASRACSIACRKVRDAIQHRQQRSCIAQDAAAAEACTNYTSCRRRSLLAA
jgi:hypothetical protein